MAEARQQNDIALFAETNFRGQRRRFGIKREDRRKHVYIIGKTGMGKSTVLENMTIQDIRAGRGVAVVDPHGEYAERMLDFVPSSRVNDVIYFNPADTEYPVAFNVMEQVSEDQRHLISSGLLGVFKKIFGPEVWSARMEYLLANSILALLEIPGSTLLGINRMLGEKDFRKRVVAQLSDPVIRGFWENEFAKYPEQYMREAVGAIQNKIGQFSSNPLIRNVVGQVASAVDMRAIMDEQKIFIINLAKGKIGEENSRLLGAMMVTKLYLTAMGRVDVPERERKDFYLYVDEFQNFATESFANILSEARKYRLNLTVAHQYVFQMEEMVQHAIFGNVGTMIVFRVGAEDGELLEKEFMPEFTIQDLVNLGFKNIYVKLMIDGITSRPFSAETLAPFPPPAESSREAIISVSRERYGMPRPVVEEKIRRFTLGSAAGSGEAAADGFAAGAASITLDRTAEGPLRSEARAERPMYEAVCAVDGKKILVPFKPDGLRPVYCEEHMDFIKFRSKVAGAHPTPPVSSAVISRGEARNGRPPRRAASLQALPTSAERNLGLRALRRPQAGKPEKKSTPPAAVQRGDHLTGLRAALAGALRKREQETMNSEQRPPTPRSPGESSAPEQRSRVLEPGETIKFE